MGLYKDWTDMVVDYVKTKGENAFWDEYSKLEKNIYKDLLANHNNAKKTTINELAKEYNSTVEFTMGFMDGINDSLKNQYDLETVDGDTELVLDINLETLYFNMLDAKAEYLYALSQWDGIFSAEKRNEIQKEYKESKIVRNLDKVGRNDACPCGSGKKYKKCCGKEK
ncbi:SEC-C metal-binding domain-containing protein [Clostridium saccharoperbutylacetonicum]|uniref:SEC-C metal-binding domain-containing protein n=1 Tax=Clostridium saccharoperbutylacetonicum TaxID=36745 RepID=UPI0039EB87D4